MERDHKRIIFGSLITAIAASYLPLIVINIFGSWINNWTMWKENSIAIGIFWITTVAAAYLRRMWIPYVLFMLPILAIQIPYGLSGTWGFWHKTWQTWIFLGLALPISYFGARALKQEPMQFAKPMHE